MAELHLPSSASVVRHQNNCGVVHWDFTRLVKELRVCSGGHLGSCGGSICVCPLGYSEQCKSTALQGKPLGKATFIFEVRVGGGNPCSVGPPSNKKVPGP